MKTTFTKAVDSGGDFLYVCPTIVPFIEENPFTGSKRQLPVEFGYPHRYRIIVTLELPDGCTVEELPESKRLIACDGGVAATLQMQQQGNVVRCLFDFNRSRVVFAAEEYTDLSAFYGFLSDLCNSRIILRRS